MLHSSKDSVNILHWILFLNFRFVNKPNSLATMFPSSRPLCVNVCLQHVPFLWGRGLKGEHQLKQLFVFMKTGQREIKEGGLSCIFWWWWIIFLITVSQWIPRLKASWLHDPSWLVISGCAACVTSILRTSYTRTQTHYIHTLRAVLFTPHIVCHMNCKSPQLLPDLPSALRLSGVCEDSVSVMHIDIFGFRRTEVVQTNLFNLAFLDRLKDTSLLAAYS